MNADQQGHEQGAFFAWLDVGADVVVDEVAHQAAVQVGGRGAHATVVDGGGDDLGAALPFLDGRGLDAVVADFLQEFRIAQVVGAGRARASNCLKTVNSTRAITSQDSNFGKPLIVQLRLRKEDLLYLRLILGLSSNETMQFRYGSHRTNEAYVPFLQTDADQEGFRGLVARRLGLEWLDDLEVGTEQRHQGS